MIHFMWDMKRVITSWGNLAKLWWRYGTWFWNWPRSKPCCPAKYESSPCTSCGHALWSDCSIEALSGWCSRWCPEDSTAIHLTLRNTCAEGRAEQWAGEWKKLANGKGSLFQTFASLLKDHKIKGFIYPAVNWISLTLKIYVFPGCITYLHRTVLLYSQIPTGNQKTVTPPPYTLGFQFKGLQCRLSGNLVLFHSPVIQSSIINMIIKQNKFVGKTKKYALADKRKLGKMGFNLRLICHPWMSLLK